MRNVDSECPKLPITYTQIDSNILDVPTTLPTNNIIGNVNDLAAAAAMDQALENALNNEGIEHTRTNESSVSNAMLAEKCNDIYLEQNQSQKSTIPFDYISKRVIH